MRISEWIVCGFFAYLIVLARIPMRLASEQPVGSGFRPPAGL